ncbi:MAG: hypothetical protein M1822_002938 [Bathelium mastoideum]|nr:MAG: hypothetical protein M1822_002938 [Bathelium mastoideum]
MDHLRHCHHREAPRSDYALENPALSSLLDSESSNSGKSLVDLHTATKRRRLGSPVESEQRQSKDSTIQRFACPYFKREPERYRTWRTCAGPGWNSISRLKEHLYRRHTLPIHCDQCWETFRSEEALAQHRTKPDPCQPRRRGSNSLDGFDGEQALKLRQRSTRDWRDVYRVLFPDAPSDEVPSPHYEHETEQTWQRPTSPLSSQFRRYEQFLSRELPSLVQQRVEAAIDPASSPVEDVVRTQLGDIVRRSQRELSTEFSLQESRTTEHQDIYPVTNGGLLSEFVVGEDGLPGLTPGSYSSFDHTGDLFLNSDAHLNEDYGFWYQETYPQLLDVDSDLQLA